MLTVMLAVSLVFCGAFSVKSEYRGLQAKFAQDQIKTFYLIRESALGSTAEESAKIKNHYPSGTKQSTGSPLGAAVELVRSEVMRDVITHLQTTSGQTLGDDPEVWIRFYAD
ncbi:hypothetical protein [Rubritalea profundi]|uniref:hypothetical protein n=1 Tax=Rubritalea profundi TaxID=1658618 RepID=UPI00101AD9EE|nr:hypothetical protein [Rubritalea profundi]